MKLKRLSYPLAFSLAALVAACSGGEEHVTPPPGGGTTTPSSTPVTPPPAETPSAAPEASAVPSATPTAEMKKEEPPPPQKTLKEKLVGVWALDFSGDVKTAAEADAKKKGGKDEKKVADLMKKAEEATAKQKVENNGVTMAMWDNGKATSRSKFEVVKEEGNTITVKHVGKDEITKKDAPAVEVVITFKDDNTIELKDPKEKDPKKAKTLTFKKTSETPAAPAPEAAAAPAKPGAAATKPAAGTPAAPAKPGTAPTGKK